MPGKKEFVPKMLSPVVGSSLETALAIGVAPEACMVFRNGGNTVILCTKDGRDRNVYGITYQRLSRFSFQDVIGVMAVKDSLIAVKSIKPLSDAVCEIEGFRIRKINDSILEKVQDVLHEVANSITRTAIDSGLYTAASPSFTMCIVDGRKGLKSLMRGEVVPTESAIIEVI